MIEGSLIDIINNYHPKQSLMQDDIMDETLVMETEHEKGITDLENNFLL